LLEVRDLRIEAQGDGGWTEIVRGVSFALGRGEVLGLIGESGAGKSTIGLAAMGYARANCRVSSGSVVFDGQNLGALSAHHLQQVRGGRIAYVAQSAAAAFNPAHRVIDQYIEAVRLHRKASRRSIRVDAFEWYRRLGLPDPERVGLRYPHELSGGQLQRVMLAMALACRPDIVVFDEPTTALDVTTQAEVLAAIKDVIDEFGIAALYISHDLAVVAQMADRIMVLRNGSMVETGPTAAILTSPREDYTRQLLAARHGSRPSSLRGETVLDVAGVTAGYGHSAAVIENVSLSLNAGSTLALVGESGSGKSTLARVICGLLPPRSGRIVFQAAVLPGGFAERSRETLRRIQIVHQMPDTALNPRHRVRDIIGRVFTINEGIVGKEMMHKVFALLDVMELSREIVHRFPSELSGGQKQRVCIARAIAAAPRLLICDEITSALDPLVARGIVVLLMRLQAELGIAYVFITHDLSLVADVADEVAVMRAGRVVEQGRMTDVLAHPHNAYTAALLAAVPRLETGWLDRFRSIGPLL
jgi:peptide/nickel transport system ATP-binding protein